MATSKQGKLPSVLMVAEKPSISSAITSALIPLDCDIQSCKRTLVEGAPPIFEFVGKWRSGQANYRITSVTGHVFNFDFPESYADWDMVDPIELFDAPLLKKPTKGSVVGNLREAGRNVDYLVLWLDCDREGENIAFEVIDVVSPVMSGSKAFGGHGGILRAKFSAVNRSDILSALTNLVAPEKSVSDAVACRQELDLRFGILLQRVALSRFQTLHFRDRFKGLDSKLLSFGPCQTPTLGFVVQRHIEIQNHVPEKYFEILLSLHFKKSSKKNVNSNDETILSKYNEIFDLKANQKEEEEQGEDSRRINENQIELNNEKPQQKHQNTLIDPLESGQNQGEETLQLKWSRGRCFDAAASSLFFTKCLNTQAIHIVDIETSDYSIQKPFALNTVEMLKKASKTLGIGPHRCMSLAERLYLQGFISYPRTESTSYPKSMDLVALVKIQAQSKQWGQFATNLLNDSRSKQSKDGGGGGGGGGGGKNRSLPMKPRVGADMGDHPPITPLKLFGSHEISPRQNDDLEEEADGGSGSGERGLGSDGWRLYSMVARHFLATLSIDATYVSTKVIAITSSDIELNKQLSASKRNCGNDTGSTMVDDDNDVDPFEGSCANGKTVKGGMTGKGKSGKGKGKGGKGKGNQGGDRSTATSRFQHNMTSTSCDGWLDRLRDQGEEFTTTSKSCTEPGFLLIISDKIHSTKPPNLQIGDRFSINSSGLNFQQQNQDLLPQNNSSDLSSITINSKSFKGIAEFKRVSSFTDPLSYLSESELISMMEKKGIGTDASIPTHIENIQKRKYAILEPGRRLKPSSLGVVLVQGYFRIDSDLVLPQLRHQIELECDAIADGFKEKVPVVENAINCFRAKYQYFVSNIGKMEPLFESSFSSLPADKGVPFSRCGRSKRYLNLITNRIPRLYNPITEEILLLPKGGTYHLSSHTNLGNCKLCDSELIIYQLADLRKYPLCAWCYNHPQPDIWGPAPYPISGSGSGYSSSSSSCNEAPLGDFHPINYSRSICSLISENELFYETGEYHNNVISEKNNKNNNIKISKNNELKALGGVLILEPCVTSSNVIRFLSTRTELTFTLPKAIEKIELLSVEGTSRHIEVHFHPQFTPLDQGETVYIGNLIEDEFLQSLLHMKTSNTTSSLESSFGGKGGKGKRSRRKQRDPKMSFKNF